MTEAGTTANREHTAAPAIEDRVKVSGALGGGLVLLTGVTAIAAAFEGGPSRMALNNGAGLAVTVGAVVLGIALAWLSVLANTRRWWRTLISGAVLSTLVGLALGAYFSVEAGNGYDRPEVSLAYDGETLSFTGTVSLLRNEQKLIATVHGYPPGWEEARANLGEGAVAEDTGSELFFASSGPSPDGKASISGQVALTDARAYEIVEVRAYRADDGDDTSRVDCLVREPDQTPAGCASIWMIPRSPTATRPAATEAEQPQRTP